MIIIMISIMKQWPAYSSAAALPHHGVGLAEVTLNASRFGVSVYIGARVRDYCKPHVVTPDWHLQ